jgi:ligand-binding sensor domain-containing protein
VYVLNGEHQWRTDSWNAGEEYIVNAIALEQGRIWFATYGGGVRRLAPVTHEWTIYDQARCGGMVDCLLSDDVFAIYIAEDGRKWLGTANGLSVLDDQGNKIVWQSFTQADGLPHSRVVALTGDGKGHIFVGTVEGLGIVNEKLGSARAQFIGGSLNGYISALAFDPDQNKLWVGTLGEGLSVWSISDQ